MVKKSDFPQYPGQQAVLGRRILCYASDGYLNKPAIIGITPFLGPRKALQRRLVTFVPKIDMKPKIYFA
jgi:hypothetical protein